METEDSVIIDNVDDLASASTPDGVGDLASYIGAQDVLTVNPEVSPVSETGDPTLDALLESQQGTSPATTDAAGEPALAEPTAPAQFAQGVTTPQPQAPSADQIRADVERQVRQEVALRDFVTQQREQEALFQQGLQLLPEEARPGAILRRQLEVATNRARLLEGVMERQAATQAAAGEQSAMAQAVYILQQQHGLPMEMYPQLMNLASQTTPQAFEQFLSFVAQQRQQAQPQQMVEERIARNLDVAGGNQPVTPQVREPKERSGNLADYMNTRSYQVVSMG